MDGERLCARRDDVLVEEIMDELVVDDGGNDVACRLNRTAALVWNGSDGTRTLADLAAVLADHRGDPEEQPAWTSDRFADAVRA
ncbi:MAG: PqqD family protein [Pseudonocardiales bacterium]|nr:PqqD family protein [Pseudonocardiales bacterium]